MTLLNLIGGDHWLVWLGGDSGKPPLKMQGLNTEQRGILAVRVSKRDFRFEATAEQEDCKYKFSGLA
jgi:hypothetical protein